MCDWPGLSACVYLRLRARVLVRACVCKRACGCVTCRTCVCLREARRARRWLCASARTRAKRASAQARTRVCSASPMNIGETRKPRPARGTPW
eukprot:6189647-Pleurochrysis_carterae.AAC.7